MFLHIEKEEKNRGYMDLLIWLTWELLGKIHRSILLGETFLHVWGRGGGGGLRKNVSQILAIIDFFKQKNCRKNVVSKEEYCRQHNFKPNKLFKLEQIWRGQLHS